MAQDGLGSIRVAQAGTRLEGGVTTVIVRAASGAFARVCGVPGVKAAGVDAARAQAPAARRPSLIEVDTGPAPV